MLKWLYLLLYDLQYQVRATDLDGLSVQSVKFYISLKHFSFKSLVKITFNPEI